MSDNFWFNESAFLNGSNNDANPDDFLNNIFDQNGGQSNGAASPASFGSANQDAPISLGSNSNNSGNIDQNINPQMFMRMQQQQQQQQQQQPQQHDQQQLQHYQQQQYQNQQHHHQQQQQHQHQQQQQQHQIQQQPLQHILQQAQLLPNQTPQQNSPLITPQQQIPQQPLDNSGKEQLIRMRQQIMQQQMLLKNGPQQNSNLISPQQQAQARLKGMELQNSANSARSQIPTPTQPPAQLNRPPQQQQQPQQPQQQHRFSQGSVGLPVVNQFAPPSRPQTSMIQKMGQPSTPQIPQQAQNQIQNQNQGQRQFQPSPLTQAQSDHFRALFDSLPQPQQTKLSMEIFMRTIYEFMHRRGIPATQPPVINGKPVNLYVFHVLSNKIGGPNLLMKFLQQPRPNPQPQNSPFLIIGQKMNLLDAATLQNPKLREQIEREISNCYVSIILPFDQYAATPDGKKEIEQKKEYYRNQLLIKYKQQLQQQQVNPNIAAQKMATPQAGIQTPSAGVPTPNMVQQSPHPSQAPTPQQRKMSRASITPSVNSPANLQSPYTQNSQNISRSGSVASNLNPQAHQKQQAQKQPSLSASRHSSVLKPKQNQTSPGQLQNKMKTLQKLQAQFVQFDQQSAQSPKISPKQEPEEPSVKVPTNVVKIYVPFKKLQRTHGGLNIEETSHLASQIEVTKPVYLFAPELGSINIHALTMGLKNYSSGYSEELFNSLNTLLVVSSDDSYAFRIEDCPELLDSLSSAGSKIVENLVSIDIDRENDYTDGATSSSNYNVDAIFDRYVNKSDLQGEDVTYVVNSLTGELEGENDSDMEIDDLFPMTERDDVNIKPTSTTQEYNFDIPDYAESILNFNVENKHHFSNSQKRSAEDDQLLLVDQLITVTMILRNISFHDSNKYMFGTNPLFVDFLFSLIKQLGLHKERFTFFRKRLCLLKDALLLLQNVAFYLQLRSFEEGFLAFALISSFGPNLKKDDWLIPEGNFSTYSYLPYAIDAFTKLLVREPHNRSIFQALLGGSLNMNSSVTYVNTKQFVVTKADQAETRKLVVSYFDGDSKPFKAGMLLTRAFRLMMSVIPFDANSFEFSKLIFTSASTFSQALFGARLLINLCPLDDGTTTLSKLSTVWLIKNKDLILSNFARLTLALVGETAKYGRESNEHRILTMILNKAIVIVNSLTANLVACKTLLGSEEVDLLKNIEEVGQLLRSRPDSKLVYDTYLSPAIDSTLSTEVIRLHNLLRKL